MKERHYINETVLRNVLNEVFYTEEKETQNISIHYLIAALKGWLETGMADERNYTNEPLKKRCDDLKQYHYTYLPTYLGIYRDKYCRNVNSSHNPLYTALDAWKVEEHIINKPYFSLMLEMLENYFKSKNITSDDIEDVGVFGRIIKRWDDKNAELAATADILTKDALYMTYNIDKNIKISSEWAYMYLNIINMIFKKEKLYMLFMGINGVCEAVEFPREKEERLNNFFWNALVPIEYEEKIYYSKNLYNVVGRIEKTNLYYHFDVKAYIQKIMGNIDSFLGIPIDIWVKALIGDKSYIKLSPSESLVREVEYIQKCMTAFLKGIDYMFRCGNIFYAEILIYKLAATGGILKTRIVPDPITLMRYLSKDEKSIIKLRHTIARYTERTGLTEYYCNIHNRKMDVKKNIHTLHIEATKTQVSTIKRFLIQNGITQVIKDDVFERLFINAKYKNKNSSPMFKEVDFFGITESDLFLDCIIKKVKSALFLGVKQQLEVKVELLAHDEKDKEKEYIFTEVFHWSLKDWWEYDNEKKNNNAAFTSFLNSIVLFKIKNDEHLLDIMREYKDEGLKCLEGRTVRVAVYPNPYINNTYHNVTEDNAYEYHSRLRHADFNYAISKNEGSYIIPSAKIER